MAGESLLASSEFACGFDGGSSEKCINYLAKFTVICKFYETFNVALRVDVKELVGVVVKVRVEVFCRRGRFLVKGVLQCFAQRLFAVLEFVVDVLINYNF